MDYVWAIAEGGVLPPNASPNAWREADGTPLFIARSPGFTSPNFLHGIPPGKTRPGFGGAFIPFGGNEVLITSDYEVLITQGVWLAGSGGQIPDGAVVMGREENGDPLFVARAQLEQGLHPGKIR